MLETAIKHHENNDLAKASELYQHFLSENPNDPDALYLYGILLTQTGNLDEAIQHYYKALRAEVNQEEIYNRLIEIYKHKNDIDKVIHCYLRLIELDPKNPHHYYNAGIQYHNKGDGENAYKAYLNATILKPDFAEAHINLGGLFQRVRDFKNAEKHLLKGLNLNDNFLETYVNLGNLYVDTAETDKVINCSEQGLKKFPDNQSLLFNIARANFLDGNLDKAWEYFKLRRLINEKKGLKTYLLDYHGSLKDKKVLVYWDSGFGDSIQFLRYVHLLREQGAKVLLKIQPALLELVESSGFDVELVPNNQDLKGVEHDFHINLTSLAYPYKIDSYKGTYISVKPEKVEESRKKYFENANFKIGFVWRSHANAMGQQNINDVKTFYPLASIPGIKFYSLQQCKGQPWLDNLPEDFNIEPLGDSFKDFSETAAALENIDLLITSDNAVAHVAGAMGKKVWVLIPTVPNWRWTMYGETTPWYDSMRIFRQKETGDWDEVIQRVKPELIKLLG